MTCFVNAYDIYKCAMRHSVAAFSRLTYMYSCNLGRDFFSYDFVLFSHWQLFFALHRSANSNTDATTLAEKKNVFKTKRNRLEFRIYNFDSVRLVLRKDK